ncbi:hypothetical protein [Methylobacterium sp. E-066]|jgi:NAD(P)H dehydrogenase (quinone)|uniref:hypothetical protein n=1 Tax=Methylobacterium sp. E-066 TaxID=2836584 RepID=UPI001FBB1F32|nr:hypothetical protein [Methylobacterium sp. E-066]
MLEAGSPYGPSAIVGSENHPNRSEGLDAVRQKARRMVAIAGALVAADEIPRAVAGGSKLNPDGP